VCPTLSCHPCCCCCCCFVMCCRCCCRCCCPHPPVRVPLYPFAVADRDYSEMARRYPHMYVAPDMMQVVLKWAQVRGGAFWGAGV
jgi:hypothetical protein